jgi:hypothetical protein
VHKPVDVAEARAMLRAAFSEGEKHKIDAELAELDQIARAMCRMRIADLLLNTHEPGYASAARLCAACGCAVANHNQ